MIMTLSYIKTYTQSFCVNCTTGNSVVSYHIIIMEKNQRNKIQSSTQTFNRTGWKQQNKMFNDRSYEKVKTHTEENCR